MKRSELRKLIKEELNEISKDAWNRMQGLSNMSDLKNYSRSIDNIFKDLIKDGFEVFDVYEFLNDILSKTAKRYK